MKITPQPVIYDGQTYASLKEFANSFNLSYSRVVHYNKAGKTPEEILSLCQFSASSKTKNPPKEGAKRFLVEYNGIQYTSLYAAAEALGLSPGRLYDLRKRKGFTPAEAIDYALKNLAPAGSGTSPKSKPCVIEGVSYPSREAAMLAYHQTRITVYSRMERDGISFEEALLQGRQSSVYRPPAISMFPVLRFYRNDSTVLPPTLDDLRTSLEHYNCKVQAMQDLITQLPALLVDNHSYIYFNHEARGIEIVSELPFTVDDATLNMLNNSYVAVKLFHERRPDPLYLFTFQFAKEEKQDIKNLLNTWFSYVCVRDKLIRNFGPKEEVVQEVIEETEDQTAETEEAS